MLSEVLPVRQALGLVKAQLRRTYAHKGERVIAMNVSAVERIANLDGASTSPEGGLKHIPLPVEWMHIGVNRRLPHEPEIAPADQGGSSPHASNVRLRVVALWSPLHRRSRFVSSGKKAMEDSMGGGVLNANERVLGGLACGSFGLSLGSVIEPL